MNFTGFYGNEPIKTVLNAHLFHAYLIEGPEGSGKRTLADRITGGLLCEGNNPPCGACRQCYKLKQNCHPDLIRIPNSISVDELRKLLAEIVFTPNDAAYKVYRIDGAEALSPAAQNLLLKTLEEPPKYAVFLLLCNSKEGLLQTVRSRCQVLSLAPLPEPILEEHFRKTYGEYNDRARAAVLLSAGFLGKALQIYEDGDSEDLQKCRRLEEAIRHGDPETVFRLFDFTERERLTAFYKTFDLYLKQRLRTAAGEERSQTANLVMLWNSAAEAMNTNINLKLWNTNLARLCLNAGKRLK